MNAKAGIQYGVESHDMLPEQDRSYIPIRNVIGIQRLLWIPAFAGMTSN